MTLQEAIAGERAGSVSRPQLIAALLAAELLVPSKVPAGNEPSLMRPLLLDKAGRSFVAAFLSASGAEAYRYLAEFRLTITGLQLMQQVPAGIGVVIDPGMETATEISADEVVAALG